MVGKSIILLSIFVQKNIVAVVAAEAVGATTLTATMKSCSNIDCGRLWKRGGGAFISLSPGQGSGTSPCLLCRCFLLMPVIFAGTTTSAPDHLSVTLSTRETRLWKQILILILFGKVHQRQAKYIHKSDTVLRFYVDAFKLWRRCKNLRTTAKKVLEKIKEKRKQYFQIL